jgi:hypothetical protein
VQVVWQFSAASDRATEDGPTSGCPASALPVVGSTIT